MQNAFHVSDSQVAIILSAASLVMFLVLAMVMFIQFCAQNKKCGKLMKKDSQMDRTPTHSFPTYTSPIFNNDTEEKESL